MRNIIKVLLNEGIEREDVVAICKYIKEEYENVVDKDYKSKIKDAEGNFKALQKLVKHNKKIANRKSTELGRPLTTNDSEAVRVLQSTNRLQNVGNKLEKLKLDYNNIKKEQEDSSNK